VSDELNVRAPTYRVPRTRGLDPATKKLALIAAGLGGTLFVVIGLWSTMGPGHVGVPIIEPPPGPMRVKPPNPGGMKLTEADGILLSDVNVQQAGKLAPAPEAPDPQALMPPAPPPAPLALTATKSGESPTPPASIAPVLSPPVSETAPTVTPSSPAPAREQARPTPEPVVPADTAPRESGNAVASGPLVVQLAALATRDQAEAQWKTLQRQMPELLANRSPTIAEARVDGRTWWRVRTGGFPDAASAKGFCEHVRSKGAACSVARF
jgi:hypothetical protein